MIRKGSKPGFRFGFERPDDQGGFRRVYPFRRSWVAIFILLAMDIAFLVPAITTFRQVAGMGDGADSLFDLVGTLFLGAWLLGWSMAPLILTSILLLMLFGREVAKAGPGRFELFLGLPFVGLTAVYDVTRMRNLRVKQPPARSGKSWRGQHFEFDYGANSIAFGSDVNAMDLGAVAGEIQMASGKTIRRGEAREDELSAQWEPVPEEPAEEPVAGSLVENDPGTWVTPASMALIIANLIPVVGTLFFGWKLSDVMVLYWAESAVIGFYNLVKIAVIGKWFALFAGPFFAGHFGGFMVVHFLFLYTLFVQGPGAEDMSGDLGEVAKLFYGLWPALLALFISHGVSFRTNFIGRQEYRHRTVNTQMSEPYGRIVFMHLVLILGGAVTLFLGESTPVLLVVIGLKILFDVKAHLKERSRRAGKGLVENPS